MSVKIFIRPLRAMRALVSYAFAQRAQARGGQTRILIEGGQTLKLLFKSYGAYEGRVHGSRTCVILVSIEQARVVLAPCFGAYGIVVIGRYFIMSCIFLCPVEHRVCTGVAPKRLGGARHAQA